MKKYSRTWTEEIVFYLDEGDVDLEVDVYPLIVRHFAIRYGIERNKADKILQDNSNLIEDYYSEFEDEIVDEARDIYEGDAKALWDEWKQEEFDLIAEDNLRRI